MSLLLYHSPGACSRVSINALEEIGLAFEDRPLDLASGQQMSPEYLSVNARGKIPALLVDGRLVTETVAIITYLDQAYPGARLLPQSECAMDRAAAISDLAWFSSGIHPVVRAIRMPTRWTEGDPAPVKARGMALFAPMARTIAERLATGPWWYGDDWSILDVYLYWNYDTASSGGFDLDQYPVFADHASRVRARPSFQRSLAREQSALERAKIQLPPGAQL